jgi:chromosome segregation ATPase
VQREPEAAVLEEIRAAEAARAAAEQRLSDLRADFEARVQALSSARVALEAEASQLHDRAAQLELDLEEARAELVRSDREIENLRGQISGLELELGEVRRIGEPEPARAVAAVAGGRTLVPNYASWSATAPLASPVFELQSQLDQTRAENAELRRRVEECQIEMKEVREAWDTLRTEMEAENATLRDKLRAAGDASVVEAQASIRRLRQQISRLENYAAILEGDKQDLLRELRAHRHGNGPTGLY